MYPNFMSYEFFIGSRYLRTKQKQAFISLITILSVAGVAVGVMALIIVIAVMSGFEMDLKSRILGVESHAVVMRHGGNFSQYKQVIKDIETLDGVESAAPFVYTQVMLRASSGTSGAVLRGIDPDAANQVIKYFKKDTLKENYEKKTETDSSTVEPGILLGKELARNIGVSEGDNLYVVSFRGMLSPIGHIPSMKRFRVTGIFESGMYEYDGTFAYINLKDAQKMLHMGDSVTGVEVWVSDIYNAAEIAEKIIKNLGFPFWARDWMQMNHNLFSALKLEKKAMSIILTLIVLVAAFNIASSLIMMVMKKSRDIGILKAMGATSKSIRKIFVFNGMVIGAVGTALGTCMGFVICLLLKQYKFIELDPNVYYISTLPVKLEITDVFCIGIAAMVICFFATLYPAIQASRIDPVEAIRYE